MSWSEWMLVGEEKERLTCRAVSIIEDEILSLSSKKSSKAYSVVLVEELFDNNQELSDEDITNAEDILTTILEDLKELIYEPSSTFHGVPIIHSYLFLHFSCSVSVTHLKVQDCFLRAHRANKFPSAFSFPLTV